MRLKWNSLRTQFVAEVKKLEASKRSGTDTDSIYQPSMTYYDDLLFLQDHLQVRQTTSNAPVRQTTSNAPTDDHPDYDEDPDEEVCATIHGFFLEVRDKS